MLVQLHILPCVDCPARGRVTPQVGESPAYSRRAEEGAKAKSLWCQQRAATSDSSWEYTSTVSWPKNPNCHPAQSWLKLQAIVHKGSCGDKRAWREGWEIKPVRGEGKGRGGSSSANVMSSKGVAWLISKWCYSLFAGLWMTVLL